MCLCPYSHCVHMYDVKLLSLSAGASCFSRHQYLKCLSLCFHVIGYCCLCLQALVAVSGVSDCNVCLCVHLHDVHCCLCLQALVAVSGISVCNVCLCVYLHDVHCCLCLQALVVASSISDCNVCLCSPAWCSLLLVFAGFGCGIKHQWL